MRQLQLIQSYFYVGENYEKKLKYHCERFTKNKKEPEFTDIELLTTWLFAMGYERCKTDIAVYEHISNYWSDWFPTLPSYQAYNRRLNELCSVYPQLLEELLSRHLALLSHKPTNCFILTDSMPIITCSGKRKGKVAPEHCVKGYNSTKGMYYYGMKLHGIGFFEKGSLPVPSAFLLGAANEHDLQAQRNLLEHHKDQVIFADKAFTDKGLKDLFEKSGGALMMPIKYNRGHNKSYKQRHKAADDLIGRAVSKIRQPIEALYSWVIEKTGIQVASKVRSFKGLLKHVFGRIAAAFLVNAIKEGLI